MTTTRKTHLLPMDAVGELSEKIIHLLRDLLCDVNLAAPIAEFALVEAYMRTAQAIRDSDIATRDRRYWLACQLAQELLTDLVLRIARYTDVELTLAEAQAAQDSTTLHEALHVH